MFRQSDGGDADVELGEHSDILRVYVERQRHTDRQTESIVDETEQNYARMCFFSRRGE